jgi:hypothetical protein
MMRGAATGPVTGFVVALVAPHSEQNLANPSNRAPQWVQNEFMVVNPVF